jgi:trafficking protein particle complex subunit 4
MPKQMHHFPPDYSGPRSLSPLTPDPTPLPFLPSPSSPLKKQDFVSVPPIDFNDKLRLASSWFGMCGISAQLSPSLQSSGIQIMQAEGFDLHSFQTLTGVIFMMLTQPHTPEAADILRTIVYELYCDYIMKNPFHEVDQVVKSELFDTNLINKMKAVNQRYQAAVVPPSAG